MRGFAILLVLAGVGYLAYTQGLPRLEERRQAEAGQAAQAAEAERARSCIHQAREANTSFGRDVRQFGRPPIDQRLWASFMLQISSELSAADSACSCSAEACASASAALLELRGIVNDLNTFARTAGPPVTDAANRLETVGRLLDRAERQAG